MSKVKLVIILVILGVMMTIGLGLNSQYSEKSSGQSTEQIGEINLTKGKFHNSEIDYQTSLSDIWEITKSYFTTTRKEPLPTKEVPVIPMTKELLNSNNQDAIYRLGHSTLLIRLNEKYILIDPVFSERASPVQWAGPKRFHQAPIALEQLPDLTAVIISHDHYDHLDKASIIKLADKVETFITPLKVGDYLIKWGILPTKVKELAWWQGIELESLTIAATPAQHFSGRSLFDKDETLWASWVIESQSRKLFYSGDSGFFSGFKEIGEKYGPFDITMIETGAYNSLWREIHMTPEESLQAHIDLNGRYMLPVHNGTFDLAIHDWHEPFERISMLAENKEVHLLTPKFGEMVTIDSPENTLPWWRELMKEGQAITTSFQLSSSN